MTIIRYSLTRLFIAIVFGVGSIPFALEMLSADRGKVQFAGLIFIVLGPLMALSGAMKMLGDGVALSYNDDGIYAEGLWKKHRARWSEVLDIGVRTTTSYALYGMIKTGSTNNIYIKFNGGVFGSTKVHITPLFLDMNGSNMPTLLANLHAAWSGQAQPLETRAAVDRPYASINSAPVESRSFGLLHKKRDPLEGAPRSGEFNADAVMSRYMAERERDAKISADISSPPKSLQPLSNQSAFGRKGLG